MSRFLKFTVVLLLLMIFCAPVFVFAAESGEFYYEINADNTCVTITGYSEPFISGGVDVTIPATIEGLPVTTIGRYAFNGVHAFNSVTISQGITTIEEGAFAACICLTEITIPDSVTFIGTGAFSQCTCLTGITIPDSVTFIGARAFDGCNSLYYITIPGSVKTIKENTFSNSNLHGITFLDGVTSIEDYAIADCSSLASITIPSSVTSIGDYAFSGCNSLINIYVDEGNMFYYDINGVLFSKQEKVLIIYPCLKEYENYIVPDDIVAIGDYAFGSCRNLISITLPDGVTSIGDGAFYGCSSLTSITLPEGITAIGGSVFSGCSDLTSITLPDGVTSIGDSAFYGCSSLTSITLPEGITAIGGSVFSGCSDLTSITLPDGVTSIGDSAFDGCSSLTSITIPEGVTSIWDSTFDCCVSLTNVTLPDGITSIGDFAFRGCISLTGITIPDSVTSIGLWSFENCNSLTSVHISDMTAWCNISFVEYESNPIKYACNLYLNGMLLTDLIIPDNVTAISDYAFYNCDSIISVTIPDGIDIGKFSFAHCSNLQNIIGDDIASISSGAFYDTAYYNNSENWENNVLYIGEHLYSANKSITGEYTVKESTRKIVESAFSDCSSLTSVIIPNGVVAIGDYAFSRCSGLTSIELPDSIISIGRYVFNSCSSLTDISLPDGITFISGYAFCDCVGLTSVVISDSVTLIESGAFRGCSGLKNIYYAGTEEKWKKVNVKSASTYFKSATLHYLPEITICYDTNGGEGEPEIIKLKGTPNIFISQFIPTKENYVFRGWATTANAAKAEYQKGDVLTLGEKDITLYAVWDKLICTNTKKINNIFVVSPVGTSENNIIIFTCYKNKKMVYLDSYNYTDESVIPFVFDGDYDEIKIMVWDSLEGMMPLCQAENADI